MDKRGNARLEEEETEANRVEEMPDDDKTRGSKEAKKLQKSLARWQGV